MRIILLCLSMLLFCSSQAQTVNVSGRFYYDANANHIFDGTDSVLANRLVNASANNASYQTTTNASGQYSFTLPLDSFDISLLGLFAYANYQTINAQHRIYTSPGFDVVDFAYQKRDSVETVSIYMDYFEGGSLDIPQGGLIKEFKILYTYDGFLQNMPAKIQLKFNPLLNFVSSSITPSTNSSGKLEWSFPSLQRNVFYQRPWDSLKVTLNIPVVGDTVGGFELVSRFIPGVPVSNNLYSLSSTTNLYLTIPEPQPIGSSSGVKWLRQFSSDSENTVYDEGISIDSTQKADGYFFAGSKYDFGGPPSNRYIPFIAKLNKEGLSVWEKNVDSINNNGLFSSVSAIKHSADGGCIVLGDSYTINESTNIYTDYVTVAKFDSSGNYLWRRDLSGSNSEYPAYNIELLQDGSFLFAGSTTSNDGDFTHNNLDTLRDNLFVTKLSSDGAVIFTKVYGGSDHDYAMRIKVLQNGSFLVLGVTESNDGDVVGAHQHYVTGPEPTDTTFSDEAWILHLDAGGNMIWNKCFGGRQSSMFYGAAENNGGILLTGYTNSKDGDLPYYQESAVTLWALQISNTGNILWSKLHKLYKGYQDSNYLLMPDLINEHALTSTVNKTRDGNFIVAGEIGDKYGSIKSKHGKGDFVFVKLNSSGDIVWQKAIGGTSSDFLFDIQLDNNDDILFVGSSYSGNDDLALHPVDGSSLAIIGKIGITNIIKGQVFVDNNNNQVKDPGEMAYSEGRVNSIKRTDTIAGRIFNGLFLNNVDTGNYVTTYKPNNNYYTVTPATRSSNFGTFDLTDNVSFALLPKPNINDLEVQLLSLSTARPGFDATYRVITKNVGTTTLTNAVIGFVKDSRQSYNDASRPESGMQADSIWWGPFTLQAFEIDTLYINLTQDAPPLLNNGDTLSLRVTANPVINDSSASNNVYRLREEVRGSFDPNDKAEAHAGTLTTTQYAGGEFLEYKVRFQNTGTDTAFFVTIKDTLQAKLDLSTLEIISASHPYTFRLTGNVATWDFKNIKLPDSTTNEEGSHGYILFRIKPKTGLPVGDVFTNNAAIYFDYNLPVITNVDHTIIGSNNGVCPNGNVSYFSGITGNTYQWQVNSGSGYTNLSNTGIYSGVTTAKLTLTNAPTSLSAFRYRCLVNGNTYSPENIMRFAVQWKGTLNNAWANAANWDCNTIPDAKTEVLVPAGVTNPRISSNVSCYSLRLSPGATVTVASGFTLNITGKTN